MTNEEKAARIEQLIEERRWREVPAMRFRPRIGSIGATAIEVRYEDRTATIYERWDDQGRLCYGRTEACPDPNGDWYILTIILTVVLNEIGAPQ